MRVRENLRLVLLGPPGAGKGTLAQVLSKDWKLVHVSTGDMLREALKKGTPLGLKAKEYMENGKLVPDEVVIGLVSERLLKKDAEKGFILDGFPRTVEQAKELAKEVKKLNMPLTAVLYFKTSLPVIIRRLSGRRVCQNCGKNYHMTNFRPKADGVCDVCGGRLIQRPDDREETIENRLKVYEKETSPLIDYYKKENLLQEVSGDLDVKELSVHLNQMFEKKGLVDR